MDDVRSARIAELIEPFRVPPGTEVVLERDHDPGTTAPFAGEDDAEGILETGVDLLAHFQSRLAAQDTNGVLVKGIDRPMPNATADGITLINFGMGSPNAATVMDLLSAIAPRAVLFLGKCGGLKRKNQIGDLILPIAAIRGEGTSNDYLPPEVPALPAFELQRAPIRAVS